MTRLMTFVRVFATGLGAIFYPLDDRVLAEVNGRRSRRERTAIDWRPAH